MQNNYFKKIKLPDAPGVYFFKQGNDILYIGKATSLHDRVRSYMSKRLFDMRGPLVEKMTQEADNIKWQESDSVLEALILEANLIKKYQPKYNTKEKSDKSFNYVCITEPARRSGGELPKILIVRGKNVQHSVFDKIYGPYLSGSQLKEALKIVRPIFPFLDEKSKNYYKFYKQVGLVPDVNSSEGIKKYKNNIKNLKLFFEGKKRQIIKNLKKEMNAYAKISEFEKAGEAKRQIFALQHINDVALLKHDYTGRDFSSGPRVGKLPSTRPFRKISPSFVRIEAYDIAHLGGKNMVGVMTVVENGEVVKSEYKKFKIKTQTEVNDTGALREVLERRLAHKEWPYPSLIVVDGGMAQINSAKAVLAKMGLNIGLVSVLKDERHKPKDILGDKEFSTKYKREILLANSESHRFAIAYHKNRRNKNFLR